MKKLVVLFIFVLITVVSQSQSYSSRKVCRYNDILKTEACKEKAYSIYKGNNYLKITGQKDTVNIYNLDVLDMSYNQDKTAIFIAFKGTIIDKNFKANVLVVFVHNIELNKETHIFVNVSTNSIFFELN